MYVLMLHMLIYIHIYLKMFLYIYVASGEGRHENLVALMHTEVTYEQIPKEILQATVFLCVSIYIYTFGYVGIYK